MLTTNSILKYMQCPKYFWLNAQEEKRRTSLNQSVSDDLEIIMTHVETLFEKGLHLPHLPGQYAKMAAMTKGYLHEEGVLIYNPSFIVDEIYISPDLIEIEDDIISVYAIKAMTKISGRLMLELSIIKALLSKVFVKTIRMKVIIVDKGYIRHGDIEADKFLKITDVTDRLSKFSLKHIESMKRRLIETEPLVPVGEHCEKGRETINCPFKIHCLGPQGKDSIFNIAGMHKRDQYALYHKGIRSMFNIKNFKGFTKDQEIQIYCMQSNKSLLDQAMIKKYMSQFNLPLYFLDFEAFRSIIPPFEGVGPTTEIPFQYSLHILKGTLEHREFLGEPGTDPRRGLAESLISHIPMDVQVVAYNMQYEKRILKALAHWYPDLADRLYAMSAQLMDLEVPFKRKWCYNNQMMGKYSIKYVLPALFPKDASLDYSLMKIQNGKMAMEVYSALHQGKISNTDETKTALRAYCHLDTLAMVKLYQWLDLPVQGGV